MMKKWKKLWQKQLFDYLFMLKHNPEHKCRWAPVHVMIIAGDCLCCRKPKLIFFYFQKKKNCAIYFGSINKIKRKIK